MKGQKQSRVMMLERKIEILGAVITQMSKEMKNLTDLSIGTLETVKQMPGYEDALEALKTSLEKENKTNVE
jgi:hypothetical protein